MGEGLKRAAAAAKPGPAQDEALARMPTFSVAQHGQSIDLHYAHRADKITRLDISRMISLLRSTADVMAREN